MLDTSKHRHLCARCAAPRIHSPPEPFTDLTAVSLAGAQTDHVLYNEEITWCLLLPDSWILACAARAETGGGYKTGGRGVTPLWELRRDDRTSSNTRQLMQLPQTDLHSFGYQRNELPRLWALFAGDVHKCVESPIQLQYQSFRK